MRERLLALAERRAQLVARAQSERGTVAALLAPADAAASMVISLVGAARGALAEARNHPLLALAGIALLLILKPRRVISWVAKGWSLWGIYRGAQSWLLRFNTVIGAQARAPR